MRDSKDTLSWRGLEREEERVTSDEIPLGHDSWACQRGMTLRVPRHRELA